MAGLAMPAGYDTWKTTPPEQDSGEPHDGCLAAEAEVAEDVSKAIAVLEDAVCDATFAYRRVVGEYASTADCGYITQLESMVEDLKALNAGPMARCVAGAKARAEAADARYRELVGHAPRVRKE